MEAADWIAIYGACLSTALGWREWRRSRRRLRITSCYAFNGAEHPPVGNFTRVTVANHGAQPVFARTMFLQVHLRSYRLSEAAVHLFRYWRLQRGTWISHHLPLKTTIAPQLPYEILPGRSVTVWLPAKDVMSLSKGRRTRLVVQDEMDRNISGPDVVLHLEV